MHKFETVLKEVDELFNRDLAQFLNVSIYMDRKLKHKITKSFHIIFNFVTELFVKPVLLVSILKNIKL